MIEQKIISWLMNKRAKKVHFALLILLTLFFAFQLPKLTFNFELEELFPKKDVDLAFFEEHIDRFGYDNDFLSILILTDKGVYDAAYIAQIRSTVDALRELDYVKSVWSPLDLQKLISTGQNVAAFPLLDDTYSIAGDSIYIQSDPFVSQFYSYQKFLPIAVEHDHITDQTIAKQLQGRLVSLLEDTDRPYHLLGKIAAQEEFNDYIKADFGLFISLSILVCIGVLWWIFRRLSATVLPLLICGITLIWVFGIMAILQVPISIMTSLIPPLMLFIASSDGVHYLSALQNTKSRQKAIKKVLQPTFLTSLTTSIGFLSLWWIPVKPISDLGIFCGVGTFLAFIITYLLVPLFSGISRKSSVLSKSSNYFPRIWSKRSIIVGFFIVMGAWSTYSALQLESNAYLLKDLPPTSSTRQSFDFGDEYLGGSKPWEIAIFLKDSNQRIWSPAIMKEVDKVSTYLKDSFALAEIRSPSEILLYASYIHYEKLEIPNKRNKAYTLAQQILRQQNFRLIAEDQKSLRITGLIPEIGSKATVEKNEQLLRYFRANINTDLIGFRLTGTNYLIDKSNELLAGYMLRSLLLAIGLVAIIMAIYFRSIKTAFVSLVPNLIPLIMVGNIIYLADIPIQFSTSIIFALTFGIVVDDTIHFLSAYQQTKGSLNERVSKTLQTAGAGIFNTSIILISGFALMMLSSFGATFYLGLFLSTSLIFALITDLILLPILIKSVNL